MGQPVVYAVGLSSRGEAVAAWLDESVHTGAVKVLASVARVGRRFGRPRLLASLGIRGLLGPSRLVSVDARGDAIVVWGVGYGKRAGLYASYRPADGLFGAPQRIAPNGLGADFGLDASGNATFVWGRSLGDRGARTVEVVKRTAWGRLIDAQRLQTGQTLVLSSIAVDGRGDAVVV
jgi:hypothetical protein